MQGGPPPAIGGRMRRRSSSALRAPCHNPRAMSGARRLTVVLADDHVVVRNGLKLLLDSEPGIEVVAEAGDVPGAMEAG